MDEMNGNGNYIDYNDLSAEKRKALYDEYLSSYPDEKRLSLIFRFAPLAFAAVIMALAIASLVIYFVGGLGVPFIIMMGVFKIRLDKIRYAHSARYASWLRDVKHVIAELK